MRLFEYEAKEILRSYGIPVPSGFVVHSQTGIASIIEKIRLPVAVKAQVLVGRRGKSGGIKFAYSFEDVVNMTKDLLNSRIGGHTVRKVLIEEKLDIKREYYLGVTIDQFSKCPIIMFSTEGGMEIEEIAKSNPESIISTKVNVFRGFYEFEARKMCKQAGLRGTVLIEVSRILQRLYEVFSKYDAIIAEINPLILTKDGKLFAADAKIEIDDDSLFRHQDLAIEPESRAETKAKAEAARVGVSYVDLDGDIGVICSGAGLGMATIDLIKDFGGKPANFLETGGGINEQLMFNAVKLVIQHRQLKALFINLYGGINPMVPAAKGIVKAYKELNIQIPILVKLVGNEQEKAWKILENAGIAVFKGVRTEDAVEKLMKLIGKC